MISRPILSKKIKRNKKLYNLELWSPTDDAVSDDRKDFFDANNIGQWPSISYNNPKGRFDNWFDSLRPNKQREYAKAIDESNRIIMSIVWDLLLPEDRQDVFHDNMRAFSNWFAELAIPEVDFYMTRIMNKQRLMPRHITDDNTELLSEEDIAHILQDVYDGINDELIRATTINGLLCISCANETRLNKAKSHLVKHGSILRDYRKKINDRGLIIYTYIFSKP